MKMSKNLYAEFASVLTTHMHPEANERERWSCLYTHCGTELHLKAYKAGLNDNHIDTALRKIAKSSAQLSRSHSTLPGL